MSKRSTGTVKLFDSDKGYGVVRRDDGRGDVVVRAYAIKEKVRSLEEGERVEFDLVLGAGGLNAANVIRVKDQN